jgi:hypothetical protein
MNRAGTILSSGDSEPTAGSVVEDASSDRWVHDDESRWWCSTRTDESESWSGLEGANGPLTLLSSGAPAEARSYERIVAAARKVLMAATPISAAWQLNTTRAGADGEELHRELREALGISETQWRDSPTR